MGATQSTVIGSNNLSTNRLSPNGIRLNGIDLNGIDLNGIDLNGIDLNGIDLNGIDLNGIDLNGIDLNGIDLNGIDLNGIDLNGIDLNGIDLNGIDLNGIDLNGVRLNGIDLNGIDLNGLRLNGIDLNGIDLNGIDLNGVGLNGVRLNGLSLTGINLATAKLGGAALDASQMSNLKLALSYVVKCALPAGQCVSVADAGGTSYSLCGASGLDPTWNTDLATSVTREHAVTQCVIDSATAAGHTVLHANQEAAIVKDFFNHAVSCALPSGQCVSATDIDGSAFSMCGSHGLDPAWKNGPATHGAAATQVAQCVASQATGHGDAWTDRRAQLTTVLQYAAECALRPDQSVAAVDWNGGTRIWQGSLGLADWWATAPLSPAPAPKAPNAGEELISACLMARSNAEGRAVSISLRARPELPATPAEAAAYGRHEGAFMGNLFGATPVAKACSGPGGGNWLWDPNTNAPMTAGRKCAAGTDCGFQYVGSCSTVCTVKPGLGGETLFDNCAGNANVVNTFLYSSTAFNVNTASPTVHAVAPSTGDAPMVATGDFNGDGNTDLAVESNAASLIVRLGKQDGGFASDVVYNLGVAVQAKSVIARDLDADGKLDLVTANTDSLSVLLGNGDGTFAAATRYPVAGATGSHASVVAADFNADGTVDLATGLATGLGVFLGNGDGTFGAQSSTGGGSNLHYLATGDFNGDGKVDVAGASATSKRVYVSWGNGNGVFGPTSTVFTGSCTATPHSLTSRDFNNDGRTDLAVAVAGENAVKVLLGQSNKTFTTTSYAVAGSGDLTFVGAAFLVGGSPADLMVIRGTSVVILSGAANGTFTTAGTFDVGSAASFVVPGHFDRDTTWRLDLLVSTSSGQLVQLNGV